MGPTAESTALNDWARTEYAVARFAACAEHVGANTNGPCDDCGWLAADHTAGLATVIAVVHREPTRLLRAS